MVRTTAMSILASLVAVLTLSCSDDDSPTGGESYPTVQQHQLVPNLWWVETRNDTSVVDSGAQAVTVCEEHRIRHTVTAAVPGDSGTIDYIIMRHDTVLDCSGNLKGVDTVTVVMRQDGGTLQTVIEVETAMEPIVLPLNLYEFPMTVGDRWTTVDESADSSMRIDPADYGMLLPPLKIRALATLSGDATVESMTEYGFADTARSCFSIKRSSTADITVELDTTLVLLPPGTALYEVSYVADTREYFSVDFALPLWSREVAVMLGKDMLAGETSTDTSTSVTRVTALCDPRWEPRDTLYAAGQ